MFQSTPPRGRRLHCWAFLCSQACFNPRLHAGGDALNFSKRTSKWRFNPRLHAGGDWRIKESAPEDTVSIHASTREATLCIRSRQHRARFNPRLHAGGDL
ncbi:MAG TPA: hypothetical protein GXX60_03790 [Anaerolineaceae bacterium]|nr:hypothetical protein [Anaerolineaceae bacterium]